MEFSPERQKALDMLLPRYPNAEAAMLPTLRLAQEEFGFVSKDVIEFVARRLDVPVARVTAVASFYTMFDRKPVGTFHIQVCQNLSCSLMGGEHIIAHLEKKLGIKAGETTADKRFTLTRVECLGACGTAPVMQINDDYHEDLTAARVDSILAELK
jgi:NADH-quinone oxidoreductase subunit E